MDWQNIFTQIRAAYFSLNGVEDLPSPEPPFSMEDAKNHKLSREQHLRGEVDVAVMEHFRHRTVPPSLDHAYLISQRYFAAIVLVGACVDAPNMPTPNYEDDAYRWLLVESWPGFGFPIWRYHQEQFFDGLAVGWGLAEQNLLKKSYAKTPSLRSIVLATREQQHLFPNARKGTSVTRSGGG